MLTSHEQYLASIKAAMDLKNILSTPADPKLSEKFVKDNRDKINRKFAKITSDISDYEYTKTLIEDMLLTSFTGVLKAPIIYRLATDMSVYGFAKKVNISRHSLPYYEERDYSNCHILTFKKVAEKIDLVVRGDADYVGSDFNSFTKLMQAPIQYRKFTGQSVIAFAEKVGVSTFQIYRYESNGYKNCHMSTFKKIIDKLGISIEAYFA